MAGRSDSAGLLFYKILFHQLRAVAGRPDKAFQSVGISVGRHFVELVLKNFLNHAV